MKLFKLAVAALFAVVATSAYAFHSGGVAECGGCHSMHSPAPGGIYLLVGTDQSSACLTCHGEPGQTSYHIATPDADLGPGLPPYNLTPGGDFAWLKKTYTFVVRGNTLTEEGQTHGHNIIAADFGYVGDTHNASSPGGAFPGGQLHCSACHDPHGKYRRDVGDSIATTGKAIKASGSYNNATTNEPDANNAVGSYRILAGLGYDPMSGQAPGFPGVPPAKVPASYNRSEATTDTRVAYGSAISATGNTSWGYWCGACHGAMHSNGNYVHPVDQNLGTTIKGNYDAYVKSGDMTGTNDTAYTSLVPFAKDGASNSYANLASFTSGTTADDGPASTDQVMCMSCHRAHASGWEYMLRWNMEGEFMTYNGYYPGTDTTPTVPQFHRGRTSTETQKAYYDRPVTKFANYQRVLCNKCHAKD
jgi:cytochrome c553